jgi:aspartate racemase
VPAIRPPGGAVDWPADEGVLGIVGGAPRATRLFCNALYRAVHASKDWHYPRVLLDINCKLPSRGRHLQLGEADPSPFIKETIRELAEQGATLAVVVCNTAHILYDRWAAQSEIPVLNIVEEAVAAAGRRRARVVAILASQALADAGLYDAAFERAGISGVPPGSDGQATINGLIGEVKQTGGPAAASLADLRRFGETWRKAEVDTVLLGCTELSVLKHALAGAGFAVIDSNETLAEAALARLNLRPELLSRVG